MRTFTATIILVALLTSAPATAEEGRLTEAFICAGVSNDIARLECYDQAYSDYRKAAAAPGNWIISSKTNPIDDTVTTILRLDDSSGRVQVFKPHRLVIRCHGDKLSVWVNWDGFTFGDSLTITSRVGKNKARTEVWLPSTSSSGTFYPGNAEALVRRLMDVDRFVVQVSKFNNPKETAIFDVRGLTETAEPIKAACLSSKFTPAELEFIEDMVKDFKEPAT